MVQMIMINNDKKDNDKTCYLIKIYLIIYFIKIYLTIYLVHIYLIKFISWRVNDLIKSSVNNCPCIIRI